MLNQVSTGVEPVFLLKRDMPLGSDPKFTVLDICVACETVAGVETVYGCQQIRSLIHIYPTTNEARIALLTSGLEIGGIPVSPYDKNPFVSTGGTETPATKVWLGEIPITFSDTAEIEAALINMGCTLRSRVINEKARDREGKITHFLTGRRFAFISVPPTPLKREIKLGNLTATIWHKEQPKPDAAIRCGRCLQEGHRSADCENEVVCRACKNTGHIQRDCRLYDDEDDMNSSADDSLDKSPDDCLGEAGPENETEDEDEDEDMLTTERSSSPRPTDDALPNAPRKPSDKASGADTESNRIEPENKQSASKSTSSPASSPKVPPKQNASTKKSDQQEKTKNKKENEDKERRCREKQLTLDFERRPRSATPSKRPREKGDSPTQTDKQARMVKYVMKSLRYLDVVDELI